MAMSSRNHWMFGWLFHAPRFLLIFAIRLYQLIISPAQIFLFGANGGCRFTPTCSQYAMDAVREQGILTGSWLAAKRICRCHPFGNCGHDPVPKAESGKAENKFVFGNSF